MEIESQVKGRPDQKMDSIKNLLPIDTNTINLYHKIRLVLFLIMLY